MANLPVISEDQYKVLSVQEHMFVKGKSLEDACNICGIDKKEAKKLLRKSLSAVRKRAEEYLARGTEGVFGEFLQRFMARNQELWNILNNPGFDDRCRTIALDLMRKEEEWLLKLEKEMRVLPRKPKEEEKDIVVSWADENDVTK